MIRSRLFIFTFISATLGDCPKKKTLVQLMSNSALPAFPFGCFMVSRLIFGSLSQLEFVFVSGVRECSNFMDLHALSSWGRLFKC